MSPIPTNRARIFRRRFSLEAPPGAYDDVEALNPTMFLQLRYPIYAGEQVLFKDAACTVPVEVAGQDTIGGVKDPFTGDIVATQSTAAARPMWGGPTVGAIFDGVDDHLDVTSGGSDGTEAWAWTTVPRQAAIGSFDYVSQFGAGGINAWIRSNSDGQRWEYRGSDDDGTQIAPTTNISPQLIDTTVREPITVRFEYSGTESTLAAKYADEAEVVNSLDPSTGLTVPSAIALGALEDASNGLDGTITEAAFALGADESYVTSLHDALSGVTVDVRQITDWADAGTGTVDGELLLLTNASNQDAIFQWDEAGSEWELVSTFDASFDADSTVDANLYPTDFRGTQNFRNPPPTVTGALAAWDFRYDDLAVGDAYSSVTDLIGSLDASQASSVNQPAKGTQSGYPGEYAVFDGNDIMDAGTVSSFNSVHEGDGFIMVAAQFRDITIRNDILGSADGSSDVGIQLFIVSSVIRFRVSDGSGSYPDSFAVEQSTSVLTNDTWATIGVSWEGTTAKWWIDGVQQGSDITITSARATGDADHPLHIGGFGGGTTEMDGDLASVFISNGGHPSTAEVAALHDWMLGA